MSQNPDILSTVKGHVIPFWKILVQRTILKQVTVSKTQEIDQAIMEILGKLEYYIPDYFLNNILLVKMKHWGNCPHINLKALNKLIA